MFMRDKTHLPLIEQERQWIVRKNELTSALGSATTVAPVDKSSNVHSQMPVRSIYEEKRSATLPTTAGGMARSHSVFLPALSGWPLRG